MSTNDLYNSEQKYYRWVELIRTKALLQPSERRTRHILNKENLSYFEKLLTHTQAKDLSYVRRVKLFSRLLAICSLTKKNLADCTREDLDKIVSAFHEQNKTPTSKKDAIKTTKYLWRVLLPETDEKGRVDDTIIPYPTRHLTTKIHKSQEKDRNERYTMNELKRILEYFTRDPVYQAYLTAIHESFTRPQELAYLKIRDFTFYDNYSTARVSSHGKGGTKTIQFELLSHPYIVQWYNKHPFKSDKDAYFFVNSRGRQLTPFAVRKRLIKACQELNIDKNLTAYSFKRNGITFARLQGVPSKIIVVKAGWSNSKQLDTYDIGTTDEALQQHRINLGLEVDKKARQKEKKLQGKECIFCKTLNIATAEICTTCQRPLDREAIQQAIEQQQQLLSNNVIRRLMELEKLVKKGE